MVRWLLEAKACSPNPVDRYARTPLEVLPPCALHHLTRLLRDNPWARMAVSMHVKGVVPCCAQYALLEEHLEVQSLLVQRGGKVYRKGAGLVDHTYIYRHSWCAVGWPGCRNQPSCSKRGGLGAAVLAPAWAARQRVALPRRDGIPAAHTMSLERSKVTFKPIS